jgi:sporulation protein YqfC
MGFIEEIKNCFSSEELPKEPIFRAVMFGDCAVYFENVCSISHYCQEEICLCLKKGGLVISGCNLYIKKYCGGDVVVCGKIKSIVRT